jgi:hypothetical protein
MQRKLRLGVVGLGRAFTVMLPTLAGDRRIALVAGADTRAEARARFAADFSAKAYETPILRSRWSMSRRRINFTRAMLFSQRNTASICWSRSRWR